MLLNPIPNPMPMLNRLFTVLMKHRDSSLVPISTASTIEVYRESQNNHTYRY